jgi:hypothetical protein
MLVGLRSTKYSLTLPSRRAFIAATPVLLTGWFLACYLMPQTMFNIHDDLEKYFAYPVRMLATGTLSPNPLGALGADTLGGQAFLQAFVASHFPLVYIGAVDGFFCLLLCVTLAGFAIKPGSLALGSLAAELSVLAIEPQMVNSSSVFSGAVLIMAVIFLTGFPAPSGRDQPSALLHGLLYAGLIALKSTLAVFVGLHFLFLSTLIWRDDHRRLGYPLAVGGWTCLFTSPWVLLHLPLYLASSHAEPLPPVQFNEPLNYFSSQPLFYGATQIHYTSLALTGLIVAMFVFLAARRGGILPSFLANAMVAAGLTTGVAYFTLIGALGPLLYGRDCATRYLCPLMIGAIPALIRQMEVLGENPRLRFLPLGAAGFGFALFVAFLSSTSTRIAQIAHRGMPLSYYAQGYTPEYQQKLLEYHREVFSGSVQSKLSALQALVPAGEPLGSWVMTPFWFDFSRNPIFQVEPGGLSMSWSHMPVTVNYFIWEYQGVAVRSDREYMNQASGPGRQNRVSAVRTLIFLTDLKERIKTAELIYADKSYLLVKFNHP